MSLSYLQAFKENQNKKINSSILHKYIETKLRDNQKKFQPQSKSFYSFSSGASTAQNSFQPNILQIKTKQKNLKENISYLKFLNKSYINRLKNITKDNINKCPFKTTEKRFKWQNLEDGSFPLSIKDRPNRKNHILQKFLSNSLEKENFENKNNIKTKIKNTKLNNNMNSLEITKRVLEPNYNKDKYNDKYLFGKKQKGISKIEKFRNNNSFDYSNNTSSFTIFINKTPITFPIKGVKKYMKKKNNDSFEESEINRIKISKKIFLDNKSFFDHLNDKDIIGYGINIKRNLSFDENTLRPKNTDRKNRTRINPINWKICFRNDLSDVCLEIKENKGIKIKKKPIKRSKSFDNEKKNIF